MTLTFQNLFLTALVFYFAFQGSVCVVEIFHLRLTRTRVPEEFAGLISPEAHAKAASYDIARTWLNLAELTCVTATIGVLTLYDGINLVSNLLMNLVGDTFAFHWMLPFCVGLVFLVLDFPFTWYREFRLPEAYGYMREPPRTWLTQQALFSATGWIAVLPVLWITLWVWRHTESFWWILGWIVCSIYLVFSLGLARRIAYLFSRKRGSAAPQEIARCVMKLRAFNHSLIRSVRITRPEDDEELPPAFAFGNHRNLHLFIRHDIAALGPGDELLAICAHAMARNKTHMYLQSWALCSAVAFGVFRFLDWFAPQSWFFDEIGFQTYGPGPYYGLLISFCIVVLPVLFFPVRLLIDIFFRHQIYASDTEVLKFLGLEPLIAALLALSAGKRRHSSCSLSIFDLLFTHEPSLLSRIRTARLNALKWETASAKRSEHATWKTLLQQKENVELALSHRKLTLARQARDMRADQARARLLEAQKTLLAGFPEKGSAPGLTAAGPGIVTDATDNTSHRLYGLSLAKAVEDLWRRYRAWRQASKEASKRKDALGAASAAPVRAAAAPVPPPVPQFIPETPAAAEDGPDGQDGPETPQREETSGSAGESDEASAAKRDAKPVRKRPVRKPASKPSEKKRREKPSETKDA